MTNSIYPCLWFDSEANEAAELYCSIFPDSEMNAVNDMVSTFEIGGQKIMCLNGGQYFKMNPSISFFVIFNSEKELDFAWNSLSKGGLERMPLAKYDWSRKYGWIQDKYGANWQLSLGNFEDVGQTLTPCLMFTEDYVGKAEEAMNYYISIFENSEISGILKNNAEDGEVDGNVKHAQFKLNDQVFMAMDSSQMKGFSFNEGVSLVVQCKAQDEIDYFWNQLSSGGEEGQCGWLKDKFGVSWQVVPEILEQLMSDPDKSQRVVSAFMQMKKFEIDKLVNA